LESKQKQLTQDIETAERRLAVERDDDRYEAVARQYGLLKQELRKAEAAIDSNGKTAPRIGQSTTTLRPRWSCSMLSPA
jgi:hypothetical protein